MRIEEYRKAIDDIDDQLLQLLSKRARLALQIGMEKFERRISVLASKREKEIFERLYRLNQGPLQEQHIREIFTAIIDTSKNLQHLYQSFEDV